MYGGHITDGWDRRTNAAYLKALIRPELMSNMNLIPYNSPVYRIPDPAKNDLKDFIAYVEKIPAESPAMFGMHSNAEINYLTNQTEYIFNQIIDIQGGSGGSGGSSENNMKEIVTKLIGQVPQSFQYIKIKERMIAKGGEIPSPYDIFCLQECEKMN